MVYTTDAEYAQFRGYTDWDDFVDDTTIPTDGGLEEIRTRANAIVNVAYHDEESDADEHTTLLGFYEMLVMSRMIKYAHEMDELRDTQLLYLSEEERQYLKSLGGDLEVKSISMYSKDTPFSNQNRWIF